MIAGFTAEEGRIVAIKPCPITLDMDAPRNRLGIPHLSHDEEVLRYLAELCRPFGTELIIQDEVAVVRI